MNKIDFARFFFRAAHDSIGQKRKYTGEPYWNHTEAVGDLAYSVLPIEEAAIGGYGHDTLEDVWPANRNFNSPLISSLFGPRVTQVIIDLTDVYTSELFPNMNRKERKQKEVERWAKVGDTDLGHISQTIKLADLINNTSDIVKNDPSFARVYLDEKEKLLRVLTRGHRQLQEQAWAALEKGRASLNKGW